MHRFIVSSSVAAQPTNATLSPVADFDFATDAIAHASQLATDAYLDSYPLTRIAVAHAGRILLDLRLDTTV